MKTILFLHFSGKKMTGGETMVYRLIKNIGDYGYQPIFLCQGATPLSSRLESEGIPTVIEPLPEVLDKFEGELIRGFPLYSLRILPKLIAWNQRVRKRLENECISLIWCSNIRGVLSIYPLKMVLRIPLVWNLWLADRFGVLTRLLYAGALLIADRVVTEYHRQIQHAFPGFDSKIFQHKFRTAYTGLELQEFQGIGKREDCTTFRLGTLCRITPRKGLDHLLEAFAILIHRRPNLELHIFGEALSPGDVAFEKRLRLLVDDYGINDKVFFNGWCDSPVDALKSIDIYVSASLSEGLPGAVREAMAMGKPVVATDAGGTGEAIIDGRTGFLVPLAQPELLANAIEKIIVNPDLADSMANEARRRVERLFSIQSFIKNYSKVFDELLLNIHKGK